MKKLIIFLAIALAVIACKSKNDPNGNAGGGDSGGGTKSWKLVGEADFSDGEINDLVFAVGKGSVPYVAYTSGDTSAAKASAMKYNGSAWEYAGDKEFSADEAHYLSMVIAGNGVVYLGYKDTSILSNNVGKLVVSQFSSGKWEIPQGSKLISSGDVRYTSMALSANDTPYIMYANGSDFANTTGASVSRLDSSHWRELGNPNSASGDKSVKIISLSVYNDVPYVVHQFLDDNIAVRKYNSVDREWDLLGVSGILEADGVDNVNIAVDDNGVVYIAYGRDIIGDSSPISVLKYENESWIAVGEENFAKSSGASSTFSTSHRFFTIVNNAPYIAFHDEDNNGKVTVMKFNGSSWEAVGAKGFSPAGDTTHVNLAVAKDGTLYICYISRDNIENQKVTVMSYR